MDDDFFLTMDGNKAQYVHENGLNYYIGEYWTAKQRQAIRLHEISYRACFKPQLPAWFINRLTRTGDRVFDPFMGRGTTALEAAIKGRIPIGNDINPLSTALVAPRINPPTLEQISARLEILPWENYRDYESEDLLAFYHPKTLAALEGLRGYLLERTKNGESDQIDKWIAMVALNRLTGHSPGFFSVYSLPPNQAVSIERQRKINEKRNQKPDYRDIKKLILKKSKNLLSQGFATAKQAHFYSAPSHDLPMIADESIALTVTSPPFLDVVDYEADNWLRCWFLGIEPKSVAISQHRKVEDWQNFIQKTLVELSRITRKNGHIAFEVGEVRGGKIRLEEYVAAAAKDLPLHLRGVMVNAQKFTKTANCWGVSNNSKGTNSNRILLFQKR